MNVKVSYLVDIALHFPRMFLEGIVSPTSIQQPIIDECMVLLRHMFGEATIIHQMAIGCSICLTVECHDPAAAYVTTSLPDLADDIGRAIERKCGTTRGVILVHNVSVTFHCM